MGIQDASSRREWLQESGNTLQLYYCPTGKTLSTGNQGKRAPKEQPEIQGAFWTVTAGTGDYFPLLAGTVATPAERQMDLMPSDGSHCPHTGSSHKHGHKNQLDFTARISQSFSSKILNLLQMKPPVLKHYTGTFMAAFQLYP